MDRADRGHDDLPRLQLQAALEQAGFHDIEIHKNEKDWLCMLAWK